MSGLVLTFLVALAASLIFTAVVRLLARRWGILDSPDGQRKLHKSQVPLWGGVAVFLAITLGLLAARYGSIGAGPAFDRLSSLVLAAGGFICLVGGIDDCCRLGPRLKLVLQIVAALPIVILGDYVHRVALGGYSFDLGWLGIPLTLVWLIGCINALNLLDGMDGLASIVGLSTAAMMGLLAASIGNDHVAVIALILAGALTGFLAYNLPPASIFLGDSGSMVIGLVVGLLGIYGTLKTSATLSIMAPTVVMTLPIFDSLMAVVRRKLTGHRFDVADHQHIHHRLLARGLNQWQTLSILGSLCLLTGATATFAHLVHREMLGWVCALTLVALLIRLRLFGHHELALVKNAVAGRLARLAALLGHFDPRSTLPSSSELERLPPDETWAMAVQEIKPWRVSRLEMTLSHPARCLERYGWTDAAAGNDDGPGWSLELVFQGPQGQHCDLRAMGSTIPSSGFSGMTGLCQMLTVFGTHFAARPLERFDGQPGESPQSLAHGRAA
jgi:UDP-GlcNAc:undecaprenyl-phosphate GlcNAc-1-phosphate transferase